MSDFSKVYLAGVRHNQRKESILQYEDIQNEVTSAIGRSFNPLDETDIVKEVLEKNSGFNEEDVRFVVKDTIETFKLYSRNY